MKHNLTCDDYKTRYKSPVYISSIWKIDYWINKGLTADEAIQRIKDIQTRNANKGAAKFTPDKSIWRIEYWMKRKGKTEAEARKIISKQQAILSARSSKYTGKTSTDARNKKISKSMKKKIDTVGRGEWAKHFGEFNGRSKGEIELFNLIKTTIDKTVKANVPIDWYIVDIITGKKIIEFYGDYWHANPNNVDRMIRASKYTKSDIRRIWKKDKIRIAYLKKLGYDVLVVWESDWNKRKSECIEVIRKYLL